jgi:hypothetical protein
VTSVTTHETGHYLAAKLLGGAPEYVVTDWGYSIGVSPNIPNITATERMIITLGGPSAEYFAAFALGYIGRKLDRTTHRTLKEASKVMSSFLSWFPFAYSASGYMTGIGDYQSLDSLGLKYVVTLPATFLLGAGITYFNHKEDIPNLEDYLTDSQKEESKERIMQGLIKQGYKPLFRDRIGAKLKHKSPLEIAVDELHARFLNLEIFEGGKVFPEKWRMMVLSVAFESPEDTQRFIEDYLPR